MNEQMKTNLLMVALELRLAAHDPASARQRLTEKRLLEMADMLDTVTVRTTAQNQNDQNHPAFKLRRARL